MGALSTAVSPAVAISEAAKTKRVIRRPTHHFNISPKAFALYPFMIAPVLPGETLKSLTYQCRAVTDPVDSPIIGWWKETYFFYVKCRDTSLATNFEAMILDPSSTAFGSAEASADSIYNFFTPAAGNAVDWVSASMERIVECYFRSQDEVWNTYTNSDGMPAVKIPDAENSFMNSLWANSEIPTASDTNSGADERFDDLERRWQNWILLRQQALTDMTWEDYLATFGVHVPDAGKSKPELIRYFRDWQYPSNTITQGTGVASSAVSWALSERADKDRFFTEPGFIVGVTCYRTKVYPNDQIQTAAVLLDTALSWMPALLKDDPSSSLKKFSSGATNSPINTATWAVDHVLDIRDLYLYGESFFHAGNYQIDAPGSLHRLATRAATHFGRMYPTAAAVDTMFHDRTPGTAVRIREDGVVNMHILGTQIDNT